MRNEVEIKTFSNDDSLENMSLANLQEILEEILLIKEKLYQVKP